MKNFFSLRRLVETIMIPFDSPKVIKYILAWSGIGIIGLGLAYSLFQSPSSLFIDLPDPGEPAIFYSNQSGNDLDRLLKAAIRKAQHQIYLEIFNLSEPSIIKLLNEKAKEGLVVKVIVEPRSYEHLRKTLNKSVFLEKGHTRGLMHRKILVIDEEQCWLGSANFTWESLKSDSNLLAGINNKELAKLLIDPTYPSHGSICNADQLIEVWNIPEAKASSQQLINAIHSARKTVRIAMFTWTRMDIAQAVVLAHKRDVRVQVILDRHTIDGASEKIFKFLKENKVPVKVHTGAQRLHHKFLLIDDSRLFFGSINWTEQGFTKNRDILVYMPALTPEQELFMNKLWQINWNHAQFP
jgi:cardiolipin synthase